MDGYAPTTFSTTTSFWYEMHESAAFVIQPLSLLAWSPLAVAQVHGL
jgi:hypothetical protein